MAEVSGPCPYCGRTISANQTLPTPIDQNLEEDFFSAPQLPPGASLPPHASGTPVSTQKQVYGKSRSGLPPRLKPAPSPKPEQAGLPATPLPAPAHPMGSQPPSQGGGDTLQSAPNPPKAAAAPPLPDDFPAHGFPSPAPKPFQAPAEQAAAAASPQPGEANTLLGQPSFHPRATPASLIGTQAAGNSVTLPGGLPKTPNSGQRVSDPASKEEAIDQTIFPAWSGQYPESYSSRNLSKQPRSKALIISLFLNACLITATVATFIFWKSDEKPPSHLLETLERTPLPSLSKQEADRRGDPAAIGSVLKKASPFPTQRSGSPPQKATSDQPLLSRKSASRPGKTEGNPDLQKVPAPFLSEPPSATKKPASPSPRPKISSKEASPAKTVPDDDQLIGFESPNFISDMAPGKSDEATFVPPLPAPETVMRAIRYNEEKAPLSPKQPATPEEAQKPQAIAVRIDLKAMDGMSANDRSKALSALAVLQRYLAAESWLDRIPLTLKGSMEKARIRNYYANRETERISPQSIHLATVETKLDSNLQFAIFSVRTSKIPRGFPVIVAEENGEFKVDWRIFAEFHDALLAKFISGWKEEPESFHVYMRRKHYLANDMPDLDSRISFFIEAPVPNSQTFAFVDRESDIARELENEIPWGYRGHPVVQLQWARGSNNQPFIRILSIQRYGWSED